MPKKLLRESKSSETNPRLASGLLLASFLLSPGVAYAHSPMKGATDFITGVLHPVSTPSHVLILLSVSLFLGQRWPANVRGTTTVFAVSAAVALWLTTTPSGQTLATRLGAGTGTGVSQTMLLVLALAIASLVALEVAVTLLFACFLFLLSALGIGLDSGLEEGTTLNTFKVLSGTWLCMQAFVFNASFYLSLCKKAWFRIGLRVLSSWIIAISLLVLAFSLKK